MREVSPVGPNGFRPPYYEFSYPSEQFKKIMPRFRPWYDWQSGEIFNVTTHGVQVGVAWNESTLDWYAVLHVADCDVKHRPWANVTINYDILDNDNVVYSGDFTISKDPGGYYFVKGNKLINREELDAGWYMHLDVEGTRNDYDSIMSAQITDVFPSSPYKPPL